MITLKIKDTFTESQNDFCAFGTFDISSKRITKCAILFTEVNIPFVKRPYTNCDTDGRHSLALESKLPDVSSCLVRACE